jgi:hypothetical protein
MSEVYMMKKTLFLILILIFNLILTGCIDNDSDFDKFIGSWDTVVDDVNLSHTRTFYSNKTYVIDYGDTVFFGIWEINNEKLVIDYDDGTSSEYDYIFSNNDNDLTISKDDGIFNYDLKRIK